MITDVKINGVSVSKLSLNEKVWWEKTSPYTFLDYVYFDGSGMIELPFVLAGDDMIYSKFQMLSTSGNLFGYFDGSSSSSNFSLYGSSSAYIRYDGQLFRNWDLRSTTGVHDIVFGPTGLEDNGTSIATWTAKTFMGGHPAVGGLPNSTSAKAKWLCYSWAVNGKCTLVPAKRNSDEVIGLYDQMNDLFYTGTFIHETAPSTFLMGAPAED